MVRFMTKTGLFIASSYSTQVPNVGDYVTLNGEPYVVVNVSRDDTSTYSVVVEVWKSVEGKEEY